MTIDEIITRFADVKRTSAGYQAKCPAHQDNTASLSISSGDNHNTLIHCHAGCSTSSVVAAAGLSMSDLFDEPREHKEQRTKPPADTNKQSHTPQKEVAVYRYVNAEGVHIYDVVRYHPKTFKQRVPDADSPTGYKWGLNGTARVLYRLPYVLEYASKGNAIFITEGEKDADNVIQKLKLFCTTGGGVGLWTPVFTEALRGAHVVILPDNDTPGQQHAEFVAKSLYGVASSVRILNLPDLPTKGDVSDWIEAGGTREQLQQYAKDTPLYEPPSENINSKITVTDISGEIFSTVITDAGNAKVFAAQNGDDIRRVAESHKWIRWTGKVWKIDHLGETRRMAERTIRNQFMWLPKMKDMAQFDSYSKWLRSSLSLSKLDAMIELAATNQNLTIMSADIDRDDWTLNCKNGTLDLRTGILRPHCKEDMNTRIVDLDYDENADCPRWEQFMMEVFNGDKSLVTFVQRALGYTLTGDTREQCFFILNGQGSNGKTTIINAVREILADYHTKTSTETLLKRQQGASTTDLAALDGARFVSAVEANAQRHLAEELVKELVGGDPITARFLYQDNKTFIPKLKLWLACNHMPKIDGQDNGMWRRIKIIPFNVIFSHREEAGKQGRPPYRDNMLADTLRMEYSGILAWMVRGCLAWQSHGLGRCDAVDGATATYKTDQDILSDFFNEECEFNTQFKVMANPLYTVYHSWSERTGSRPWAYKTFISKLKEHEILDVTKTKHGVCCYGIQIKNRDNTPPETDEKSSDGDASDANMPFSKLPSLAYRESTEVMEIGLFPSPSSPEHENQPKTPENDPFGDANKSQSTDNPTNDLYTVEQHGLYRAASVLNFPAISYQLDTNGELTMYGIPANKTAWKNQISQMIHNNDKQRIKVVAQAIQKLAQLMTEAKKDGE